MSDCQKRFKYILVDEYQDTNYAQNEIVKLLASKDKNITVGDDDQIIYRFRGALYPLFDFTNTYKNRSLIVSTETIAQLKKSLMLHTN